MGALHEKLLRKTNNSPRGSGACQHPAVPAGAAREGSRLENQALILKVRQGRRGGAIRLTLTPDGEKALADTLKRESIRRVMSGLDDGDCQNLVAALVPLRRLALRELGLSPDGPDFDHVDQL